MQTNCISLNKKNVYSKKKNLMNIPTIEFKAKTPHVSK